MLHHNHLIAPLARRNTALLKGYWYIVLAAVIKHSFTVLPMEGTGLKPVIGFDSRLQSKVGPGFGRAEPGSVRKDVAYVVMGIPAFEKV